MDFKIKVCGLKHEANYAAVTDLKPDYVGLIFYERSPRCMKNSLRPSMLSNSNIKKTGVFVNSSPEEIKSMISEYNLDAIQLHGNESPAFCLQFKDRIQVIKAFSIDAGFNFQQTAEYEHACDQFLFDTKGNLPGGNGNSFDWHKLREYDQYVPFFLSGGIGPDNITKALEVKNVYLYGFDINSLVESEPGVKDINKVKQVIQIIRKNNSYNEISYK